MYRLFARIVGVCVLVSSTALAQGLTGSLIGGVKDAQGGALPGAAMRVSSPALIGGPVTAVDQRARDSSVSRRCRPGPYALDIELPGFASYHEEDIRLGAGATIETHGDPRSRRHRGIDRRRRSRLADRSARPQDSAPVLRPDDLKAIPTRRASMFDFDQGRPGRVADVAVERHARPPFPRSAPAPTRTSS